MARYSSLCVEIKILMFHSLHEDYRTGGAFVGPYIFSPMHVASEGSNPSSITKMTSEMAPDTLRLASLTNGIIMMVNRTAYQKKQPILRSSSSFDKAFGNPLQNGRSNWRWWAAHLQCWFLSFSGLI